MSKAKRFEELLLAVFYDVRVDENAPYLPHLVNEDSAYLASDARCIFLDASLAQTSISKGDLAGNEERIAKLTRSNRIPFL